MTKKEYKAKLDRLFEKHKDFIEKVKGIRGLMWLVRTYLKDGGQTNYYYDFNTGKMVIDWENTKESAEISIGFSEVSYYLGDMLGEFDCIHRKCVWLGENPFKTE